jgi:hypothetical protein
MLTAISRCIDAAATITRIDMHHMQAAAAASQIYSAARLQPENRDRVHIYRYRPATTDQIANLLTTYDQAVAATSRAIATLDDLLNSHTTPGDSRSLARAIGHTPVSPQRRQHALPPEQRPGAVASQPDVTGLERLLHDLKISEPDLLLRATALDHASRALATEAITIALNRTTATEEAVHSGYPYSRTPGPSARLASQDTPGPGIAPATTATAQVRRLRSEPDGKTPRRSRTGRR